MAQTTKTEGWLTSPGVLGTMALLVVVMLVAVTISAKVDRILKAKKLRKAQATPIADEVFDPTRPRKNSMLRSSAEGPHFNSN